MMQKAVRTKEGWLGVGVNGVHVPGVETLPELWKWTTVNKPLADAFHYLHNGRWIAISTDEFDQELKALAVALHLRGISQGDTVGIIASPSPWWLMMDFALQSIGAISVPLFPYQDKKASIGKAENERIVLGAQLNEQQRKVEAGIEEYVFGIISATEQRNSAESSLLYAEENYRQVYEKYRLSKATLLDVSEAESLLSDARYQLLSARYSLYKYCFGLKYLLGFEDDGKFKEFLSTQA